MEEQELTGDFEHTIYDFIDLKPERRFFKNEIFETIPDGIFLTDVFSGKLGLKRGIEENLRTDGMKFSYQTFREAFIRQHHLYDDCFMPFHYLVEIVEGNLIFYTTRPLPYKSRLEGYERHITIALLTDVKTDKFPNYYYEQLSNLVNSLRYIRGFSKNLKHHLVYDDSFTNSNFIPDLLERRLI
jgi:hypothetical protein